MRFIARNKSYTILHFRIFRLKLLLKSVIKIHCGTRMLMIRDSQVQYLARATMTKFRKNVRPQLVGKCFANPQLMVCIRTTTDTYTSVEIYNCCEASILYHRNLGNFRYHSCKIYLLLFKQLFLFCINLKCLYVLNSLRQIDAIYLSVSRHDTNNTNLKFLRNIDLFKLKNVYIVLDILLHALERETKIRQLQNLQNP